MVNGIGNVDFMILFTYVSTASVLIRSVRSGGAVLRGRLACFSLNESFGNYLINQTPGGRVGILLLIT